MEPRAPKLGPGLPGNAAPSLRHQLWEHDKEAQRTIQALEELSSMSEGTAATECEEELESTGFPCGSLTSLNFGKGDRCAETPVSGEVQGFHQLLLALATEHQLAMDRLRAELKQRPDTPFAAEDDPDVALNSTLLRGREVSGGARLSFTEISQSVVTDGESCALDEAHNKQLMGAQGTLQLFFSGRESWQQAVEFQKKLSKLESRFCCRALAGKQCFNFLCALMIVLSSALQGWAANEAVVAAVQGVQAEGKLFYQWASAVLTAFFCMELIVRVFSTGLWRCACRKDEEWAWNLFDAFIVACDLVQSYWDAASLRSLIRENVNVVRMLRIFRITRMLRVVRLLRFFRELRVMVHSVVKSAASLFWAFLLLGFTIYMFAVYFIQIFVHHLESSELPDAASPDLAQLKEMFGSLASAEYSLYLAISGGISWGEISRLFMAIDAFHGVVFCAFVFFTTFAVLNIITGIFVETAVSGARNSQEELVQEQLHATKGLREDIQTIFGSADADGDGLVSFEEFERLLGNKEIRAYLDTLGIGHERARGLFELLDLDQSGEIGLEEFTFGCLRLKGVAKSIDLASLMNHQRRLSKEWRKYFRWSENQFRRLHDFQKRVDGRLSIFDAAAETRRSTPTPGAAVE